MSIKSIKEKELLVNLAKSFGQKVDPTLLSEVEQHKKFENNIRESIRSNIFEDLSKALTELKQEADRVSIENDFPLPPSLDDLDSILAEEENVLVQAQHEETPTETPANTLSELAAEAITASAKRDSFQQPDPLLVAPDVNSIQKKIRFLEQWIAKVSQAGPGGGETKLRFLDDVNRDSIVNGYVLSYDEPTNKFTFISPTAASFNPLDVTQVFAEVKNAESITITKGQAVYLFAATGNKASVKLANNTGDPTSAKTLGLVYSDSITPGGTGYVITQGVVTGLDTQAYNEGDTLYLANTAGLLTSVKPYAPEHLVYIGVVERANQGQGQIYVRPQNGYELNEIHDVSINRTTTLSNNNILVWNSSSNLWINRPVSYLNQTTANIVENNNLYYTNARVYSNVIGLLNAKANVTDLTTANVIELNNLYFTNARAVSAITNTNLSNITVSNISISSSILNSGSNPITLWSNDSSNLKWRNTSFSPFSNSDTTFKVTDGSATLTISTGLLGFGSIYTWVFDTSNFTFPDGSKQSTAFTNAVLTTANVIEINNLYYTNARVYSNVIGLLNVKANVTDLTTSNIAELNNLYYTNARVYSNVIGLLNNKANLIDLTTANVIENNNLYYTNARVYSNVIGLLNAKVNVTDLPNANVATATRLTTARTINGTSFDGTANITITAVADTLTGTTLNSTVVSSNLTSVGTLLELNVANSITIGDSILSSGATGGLFPLGTTNIVIGPPDGNTNIRNNLIIGSGKTIKTSGAITANATPAFIAGTAAESGVALEIPREGGIRNMYNGDNTMYFDVSNGGSTHGHFSFRGSSAFTQYAKIDNSGIDAISSYKGKAPFNSALDTVVTVDNLKFRISNQGGVFPQVASASGGTVDIAYSAVGYVNGVTNPVVAHNSGYILAADGTWLSLYSSHGMDDRGDFITFHLVDKNAGKIYRVTFMVTNNSSNTTGYNILVERII